MSSSLILEYHRSATKKVLEISGEVLRKPSYDNPPAQTVEGIQYPSY